MFPHFPLPSHLEMLHPYHPAVAPPDLPSDFRAFYPYTPNEVKHRKRTTSTQLRTLENVFKRETKPNAALRNQLAEELKMTPRGVQVWFQNRRAKEKTKVNKVKAAAETTKHQDAPSPSADLSGHGSPDPNVTETHQSIEQSQSNSDQSLEMAISADSAQPHLDRKAPPVITPPQLQLFADSGSSGWEQSAKGMTANNDMLAMSKQRSAELTAAQLYALRRGSLPVQSPHQPTGSMLLCPPSALHRRASVDTTFHRAGINPQGTMSRTPLMRGHKLSPSRSPPQSRLPHAYLQARSGIHPHQHYMDMRRGSMDSRTMYLSQRGATASPFPSPLSMYHGPRASLPISNNMYSVPPTRTLSPPGPGPLPTPNFQFGAASSATAMASSSSGDSDRNSPDSPNSFTYRENEGDDDNASISSCMPHSRFGSFQSVATSESGSLYTDYTNLTSALPSPAILSGRRHSCTPAFVGLMSALGVGEGSASSVQDPVSGGSYPHEEAHVASNEFSDTGSSVNPVLNFPEDAQDPLSAANLPVSRDSELAFALENQSHQIASSKLENHMTFENNHLTPDGTLFDATLPDYECAALTTSESAYNVPYSYLTNDHTTEGLQTPVHYTQCAQLSNVFYGDLDSSAIFPSSGSPQNTDHSVSYA